jgi:hypothetical protein
MKNKVSPGLCGKTISSSGDECDNVDDVALCKASRMKDIKEQRRRAHQACGAIHSQEQVSQQRGLKHQKYEEWKRKQKRQHREDLHCQIYEVELDRENDE